ncbi:mandelate racemase/muconate lactonizing enzyme family protein [Verticiella sediminum]|uniref:Mandelate racemase/muconate lactonizing enzyme family protein n=1 Tax=Verticiella sediminum TaxID=1247510 RepID=A0A556B1D1_9BURK|nr:mandelate racemase/muconate lactonizing enzyme family protein [Verticiella sediminum]TSH98545.1 mandelate racemase/muconate lactonizing enzyme family protein [Verticiella sediminum]
MHRITRVKATPLNVPIRFVAGEIRRETSLSACYVEVETDQGIVGHGLTAITEEEVIGAIVDAVAGPAIVGMHALAHEAVWDRLYWLLCPRGQTGYGMHAIAAIDVALWDIKGKILGQPVWRLLGGARNRVPLYATFGFGFLDREALAASAHACQAQGFDHLKMVVGHGAMQRRDEPRPLGEVIREDAERVRIVREAAGAQAGLYIDANCSLDAFHANKLARAVADCDLGFFEEPVSRNDVHAMADLRRQTGVAVAAGQNEGLAFRFRDMLAAGAVDCVQPNVVISGGYTQAAKIAGMADAHGVALANGGAFPLHNMHLHAGLANGGRVEWHLVAVEMMRQLYDGFPEPERGWLTLPETPGLGFEPDRARIRELAKLPASGGRGKG